MQAQEQMALNFGFWIHSFVIQTLKFYLHIPFENRKWNMVDKKLAQCGIKATLR